MSSTNIYDKVHGGSCLISFINVFITIANKTGLRADPWCKSTSVLNHFIITPLQTSLLSHYSHTYPAPSSHTCRVPRHFSQHLLISILLIPKYTVNIFFLVNALKASHQVFFPSLKPYCCSQIITFLNASVVASSLPIALFLKIGTSALLFLSSGTLSLFNILLDYMVKSSSAIFLTFLIIC